MSYTALYRKFRPERFEDVKGQDHIVSTLKNQLLANRVGHAYLFCGTRGTGKTTIAKLYAKAVNCENPVDGSPCGVCKSCRSIASGASMNVFEIDAASNNGVDNIREIVEEVAYPPAEGKYKVYIIDEVHMLSTGAFNAMLKTLEEPPAYVIFILATTEVHKIPITILSRCQRYDFKRITVDTIADRMRELVDIEGIAAEDRALRYIARAADGSMRDGLSLLEQCVAFHYGETLTYENALDVLGAVDTEVFSRMLRALLNREVSSCIRVLDEVLLQGREPGQFVSDLTWYLRNLLLVRTSTTEQLEDVIDLSADRLQMLREEALMTDTDTVMRFIRELSELSGRIRYSSQKRVQIEVTLIRLCRPQMEQDAAAMQDRIGVLEGQLSEMLAQLTGMKNQLSDGTYTPSEPRKAPAKRPTLPAAVTEDVERVVANWMNVVGLADQPMRQYLKSARLSLDAAGHLLVVLPDGICYDYCSRQENQQRLKMILGDVVHKDVEFTVKSYGSDEIFEENHVDLTDVIHMEIEED